MATAHEMTPDHEGKEKVMKSKNGKKIINKARATIHRKKGLEAAVFYYISESLELFERGVVQNAPSLILTNAVSLPSPSIYFGKPEYEEKKKEYAKEFAKVFANHFDELASPELKRKYLENQSLDGTKKSDVAEIAKAYLSYSHVLTISPKEAAQLTESEQVKLLLDMRDFFYKRFTNEQEMNHLFGAFPHIKYDPVNKEYKSHLHLEMSSLDFNGKKLDLHMSKERMNMILIEMEKHPYFGKFLEPTNTLAAARKLRPETAEQKKIFINLIKEILKDEHYDVESIHRAFIDKGIKLTPHHESTKLTDVIIEYKGEKISLNSLTERGNKAKTLLFKYYELKKLSSSAKKDIQSTLEDAKKLILDNSNLSPDEFIKVLNDNNLYLIPTITAKGIIQGYGVYFSDLKETIKLSTIGVKKTDLPFLQANPAHINLLRDIREKNLSLGKTVNPSKKASIGYESATFEGFGERKNFRKKRKLMYEYKTIEDYMNEHGGKFAISLKKNYEYQNGKFINNRSNKTDFKIIKYEPQKSLEVSFSANTDHAATALIQMYLENGFTGIRITKPGSIEQSRKIWRAAMMKAGPDFKIEGYTPTADDMQWFEQEKAKQVQIARESNHKAILAYKSQGMPFDLKVVSNQWKTLFNDPYAYAFVDLLKSGVDPLLVMAPPKPYAKGKATKDDMKELYPLIIQTVKKECPHLLEQAQRHLDAYKPTEMVKPPMAQSVPVPVALPVKPPAPVAEPAKPKERTADDVMREHREDVAMRNREQQARESQRTENANDQKQKPNT